ncbi:hypothetical protein HMPREF1544_03464 [Mucor circinelloides 1006PhL]|uniref:RRN7-type domain-containing protein n=1 Tax=Mucor circinelloides f. circinelloides (strain 1006PhL) TaxID=1220926 RepID=S2KBH4_MUCC1|nr:hypothetical protein HMPREF1544_03464 [Mucor circinelloides 1006PhL]KAG1123526.1 hypothetical protein G6F42_010464 [Rhizopus arrhizus]
MKRECPTCRTTKFKKSSDGGLVCKYGHKMLGIQVEEQEGDFAGVTGRERKRTKTLRDNIQGSNPVKEKSDFLLIFQYTLQVLTRCMVQELDFPPEIEPVVRELWLLYLADSKQEIMEAYIFEANEKEVQDSQNKPMLDILERMQNEEVELDNLQDSSSSEGEDGEHDQARYTERRPGVNRVKWPKLAYQHTLVFIYIACVYLNYPIVCNDLIRWSTTGQIPYLNMQEKIPMDTLASLHLVVTNPMTRVPSVTHLERYSHRYINGFEVNCKVAFPELNIPLYLDRFCCQFFLPVEGYHYANYIFETRRQIFYINTSSLQPERGTHVTTTVMASVIAAVKLIYGVDDRTSDLPCVSQFDTSTTKETWYAQIEKNLARWKSLQDDQNGLKNMIQYLQETSVASKATAHLRDKHNVLLNILNREPTSRMNQARSSVKADPLLDASDLVVPAESSQDDEKPLIRQGEFFYSRKAGFAPKNYLNIVSLASMILGQPTSMIESAVKLMDGHILRQNQTNCIRPKKFREHYIPE